VHRGFDADAEQVVDAAEVAAGRLDLVDKIRSVRSAWAVTPAFFEGKFRPGRASRGAVCCVTRR
jgi:hypothetical protein